MDFLLEALLDSLKILPFLFVSYILIEVIEYFSATKFEHKKLLTSKWSTLFGASFGLVPQCGFSVVATDLYAEKKLSIGTLLAIYITTSDEAVPILLTNPDKILSLLPLLVIKFVVALIVGYSADLILKKFNQRRFSEQSPLEKADQNNNKHDKHEYDTHEHSPLEPEQQEEIHKGCCGHEIDNPTRGQNLKRFLLHPLLHSLKIFAFILIVNVAFGGLIELVGIDAINNFLSSSKAFAPLIACVVGLIPNCASSVVLTELYVIGGIGFGACIAGLIVNAGIAFVVLFKENKSTKQNFAILGAMFSIGLIVGYIIQLIGF